MSSQAGANPGDPFACVAACEPHSAAWPCSVASSLRFGLDLGPEPDAEPLPWLLRPAHVVRQRRARFSPSSYPSTTSDLPSEAETTTLVMSF